MGSATTKPSRIPAHIAVTSVRIEKSKLEAFKRVAESNRRTVSQEMRWLIDRAIREATEHAA